MIILIDRLFANEEDLKRYELDVELLNDRIEELSSKESWDVNAKLELELLRKKKVKEIKNDVEPYILNTYYIEGVNNSSGKAVIRMASGDVIDTNFEFEYFKNLLIDKKHII